jgi:hypothetical protein
MSSEEPATPTRGFNKLSFAQREACWIKRCTLNRRTLRVEHFLASGFLCSQTESTPAPAPVTQTVRLSLANCELSDLSYVAELYLPAIRHCLQGEDNENNVNPCSIDSYLND